MAATRFRARYEKGALTPLGQVDLAEGGEVEVFVRSAESPAGEEPPPAHVMERLSAMAERLIEQHPDDGRERPADGSINYKHYLYGHPKRER